MDPIEDATRALYAVPPAQFMAERAELVAAAKTNGDEKGAQAIGKLRKPTNGAWIVNALVRHDAKIVDQLNELGDRLRAAQDALDAARMRDLTTERRSVVAELTRRAFNLAGYSLASSAQRDEVLGSFDAAVADPDIAARLGKLQRPEQFSGFGFTPAGPPQLKLVHGGREQPAQARSKQQPPKPKLTAAQRRHRERILKEALDGFELAEAELDEALAEERDATEQVKRRERELAAAKDGLDMAKHSLDNARETVRRRRKERRDARSTLDSVEREQSD